MNSTSHHLLAAEYVAILAKMNQKPEYFQATLDSWSKGDSEKISITGFEGQSIDLYLFRPTHTTTQPTPVIYYAHGGGYLTGHATMYAKLFQQLADEHQATVVSVEYRLATQAPYPADLQDAYAGLDYIYHHASSFALDSNCIILMGESAGGGLIARLALYNKAYQQIPVKGQVLIYPMLDYRTGGDEDIYQNQYAGEFIWTKKSNQLGWRSLKGDQQILAEEMPYFSAATANIATLKGLPDTFIAVGALDLFVDENLAYAHRLIQAGVTTELHCIAGVFHGFDLFDDTPQTVEFNRLKNIAIRKMLQS